MEWQPIKTAPKREKVILYSKPIGYQKVGDMIVGFVDFRFIDNPEYKYTHWMQLPQPPVK